MSQAPDIETLFNFEQQIEDAVYAVMSPILTAVTPFEAVEANGVRAEIVAKFDGYRAVGGIPFYQSEKPWPQAVNMTLKIRVITDRKLAPESSELRGLIRKAFLPYYQTLNIEVLPYLEIAFMNETGHDRMIDETHDADVQESTYSLAATIRPDAWPTSP